MTASAATAARRRALAPATLARAARRAAAREARRGALFVCNHSGGKDSQAVLIAVLAFLDGLGVPRGHVVVMHATLGEVEWPGALELARAHAARAGVAFHVAEAGKTFFALVRHRATKVDATSGARVPAFPTQGGGLQCRADLKRDPIMREARAYAAARGFARIVTCLGLRAEESSKRATARPWQRDPRGHRGRWKWFDWLPIHRLTEAQVFAAIAAAGEAPHPAYPAGNERLSCVFCVLGSARDARNGALHNPELFAAYVALERETGSTVHHGQTLEQFAGLTVAAARAGRRHLPLAPPDPVGCARQQEAP